MASTITKFRLRSISLPSRSHPTTASLDEYLIKLKSWDSSSCFSSRSIISGLTLLADSYLCLNDLLGMPSTHHVISRYQDEKAVQELVNGSVMILDFSGISMDMLSQIKEHVQALHSALRRRKGDSTSTRASVSHYNHFLKTTKKNAKKLMAGLKQVEARFGVAPILNPDHHHLCAVVRVIREVIGATISVLQSLLSFLGACPWVSKPKWLVVARLLHKGVIASEDINNSESESETTCANELQSVDSALSEGGDMKGVHERLEALEVAIERLESGLETVFRRLIQTRASLLNIISQ